MIFGTTLRGAKAAGTLNLEGLSASQLVRLTTPSSQSSGAGIDVGALADNAKDADNIPELAITRSLNMSIIQSSVITDAKNGTGKVFYGDIPDVQNTSIRANSSITLSNAQGGSYVGTNGDLLISLKSNDDGFAALISNQAISGSTVGGSLDLFRTNTADEIILFTHSSGNFTNSRVRHIQASFIGDIDGDNRDDIALSVLPEDPTNAVSGIYIILAKALDNVGADNLFIVDQMSAADGFVITDSNSGNFFDLPIASLGDADGDGLHDLYIMGKLTTNNNRGEGYLIPGADLKTAIDDGVTELEIQSVFNDETQ